MAYYAYLLKCSDGTFYAGSTNDLEKRLHTHNNSKTGARYTKARRPVILVYSEQFESKSEALKREWAFKQMERKEKMRLAKVAF